MTPRMALEGRVDLKLGHYHRDGIEVVDDAEWLTGLLLVAACQRDSRLPLSVPYGPLSCDDI